MVINMRKINIEIKKTITGKPDQLYEGTVRKTGNGAHVMFMKEHIGRMVYIVLQEDEGDMSGKN